MADIASNADVGYFTLKELLPKLEKKKIIVKTRISGKSPMYKLNKANPMVKKFVLFYWDLTSPKMPHDNAKEEITIPA